MLVRRGLFGAFDNFGTGCGVGRVVVLVVVDVVVGVKQALRKKGDIPPFPPFLLTVEARIIVAVVVGSIAGRFGPRTGIGVLVATVR